MIFASFSNLKQIKTNLKSGLVLGLDTWQLVVGPYCFGLIGAVGR
jgi:hypothetical protein